MNNPTMTIDQYSDRFLQALDNGDLQTLAWLWDEAYREPALAQVFLEMMAEVESEMAPGDTWKTDVEKIRWLIDQHFPATTMNEPPPLTVGDVASKLQAERAFGSLSEEDLKANSRLLVNATPLPDELGAPQLERWIAGLDISASSRYWKQFRKTAVLMQMSRCQQGAKLQAARRALGKEQRPT